MSNRFQHILKYWYEQKLSCLWVLATIIETKGSAYRKAGAKMMINSYGQSFGLLSGGCLESDLMRQAQKCWDTGKNHLVCYDMQDESDIAWQLGIGCGGMVKVLLQPVDSSNNFLQLSQVYESLLQGQSIYYLQNIAAEKPVNQIIDSFALANEIKQTKHSRLSELEFVSPVKVIPTLAVFGGGSDTIPLINLAKELGWFTVLVDSRSNYARRAYFKNADEIIKQPYLELFDNNLIKNADAIIVMNHNLTLDAEALQVSERSNTSFIGLLGPSHRTERVFNLTEIADKSLSNRLVNPVGLDLGGELPESIALAILSQVHAHIESGTTCSIMHKLAHF